MKYYAIHDPANGEIIRIMSNCSEDTASIQKGVDGKPAGYASVSVDTNHSTHYINTSTGKANQRPQSVCVLNKTDVKADAKDQLKLSKMHSQTTVDVSGPVSYSFTVDSDESYAITFNEPGEYRFRIRAPFPALEKEFAINATD